MSDASGSMEEVEALDTRNHPSDMVPLITNGCNGHMEDERVLPKPLSATDSLDKSRPIKKKKFLLKHNGVLENVNRPLIKREPGVQDGSDVNVVGQHPPSIGDDLIPNSTSQSHKAHSLPNSVLIKVFGDGLGNDGNQPDVVSPLSKKRDLKVVIQMFNNDGQVMFEDNLNPASTAQSESNAGEAFDYNDSKLFSPIANGLVEKQDHGSTVRNTIRELATRLGRMEQLVDCPICGDTVTGFHYGVQTCESCKGFFKRTVQNKKAFKCLRNGDCEVHLQTRKKCPSCRFQKCCDVGMRVEGIREDRSRGGRSNYEGASAFLHRRFKRCSESSDYPLNPQHSHNGPNLKKIKSTMSPDPEKPPEAHIPELLQQILALEFHYEEITTEPQPCCVNLMTNGDKNKFDSMLHITEHRLYQIVKWARHLPNFLHVHTDDQVHLLQNSWAELTCLGVIWRSRETPGVIQLSYGKTIDLAKAKEMDHEEVISRMLYVCENFRRLKVDEYEYVTLKVLALMLPDIKGLINGGIIQDYQNKLLDALMQYTTSFYPDCPLKFGELLLRLSEVQRLTAISRQQILHLQSPELEKNNLLMELLRHQSFGRSSSVSLSDADALHVINSNYRNEHIIPFTPTSHRLNQHQRNPSHGIAVVAPTTASRQDKASKHEPDLSTNCDSGGSYGNSNCGTAKASWKEDAVLNSKDHYEKRESLSSGSPSAPTLPRKVSSTITRHSQESARNLSNGHDFNASRHEMDYSRRQSLDESQGRWARQGFPAPRAINLSSMSSSSRQPAEEDINELFGRNSSMRNRDCNRKPSHSDSNSQLSEGSPTVAEQMDHSPSRYPPPTPGIKQRHDSKPSSNGTAYENYHGDGHGHSPPQTIIAPPHNYCHPEQLAAFNNHIMRNLNMDAFALGRFAGDSLESKMYNERLMASRFSSPEFLAQQYAALTSTMHSQQMFDNIPQDFTMDRLTHSYDPGGA